MDEICDIEDVSEANEQFYRALEESNIFAMSDVWLQADWVKCVHPGWELLVGWPSIRESWERIFENTIGMRVSASDVIVTIQQDLAIVCCSENLALFLDSNSPPVAARTAATNLFKRVDQQWLMIHHHASQIPNAGNVTESEMIQ